MDRDDILEEIDFRLRSLQKNIAEFKSKDMEDAAKRVSIRFDELKRLRDIIQRRSNDVPDYLPA